MNNTLENVRSNFDSISRKKLSRIGLILLFIAVYGVSCSDNGTGATETDETDGASNGLAIRAVNTGSEDFEISYGGMNEGEDATGSTYCYSESGCEDLSGGGINIIYPENESIINESNPEDGKAVGVKISLHVDAGTGYFEVVRGESYRDDAGFREFNPEEVVSKTDTYSEGDLAEFEWGKTD